MERHDEPDQMDGAGGGSLRAPPYVAYSTLLTLLKELKDNGLPPQLDKSVLKRFAFGIQGQLKMALRSLGMLDGDKPTPLLKSAVDSYETDDFGPLLLTVLKEVYPYIFALDLMSATPTMLADAFKTAGVKGEDSLRKCRSFFMNAAKEAGVEFGTRLATGTAPRSTPAPRRKPKVKPAPDPAKAVQQADFSKPEITDKALEYRLIDILREDGVDDAERSAIWTLVQYLTAKAKKEAASKQPAAS